MTRRPTLPRLVHPLAWWVWGVGVAALATRTTNPGLLGVLLLVCLVTGSLRRDPRAPDVLWFFVALGASILAFRLVVACVLGSGIVGKHPAFRLPEVPLPDWFGSIRLGGQVTWEGLLMAGYEGMQLATVIVAIGAANALATPRRVLRYLPATLYDVGTACVVGLTYAPQLAADARRVRAARRLRGHTGGVADVARMLVPVLDSGLERSLELAASMESRGYGRSVDHTGGRRHLASALTLAGAVGVLIGLYGLFDSTQPPALGLPMLLVGGVVAAAALLVGAGHDRRSSYRREPWALPEWLVVGSVVLPLAAVLGAGGAVERSLTPSVQPLHAPVLTVVALLAMTLPVTAVLMTPRAPGGAR